MDTTVCCSSTHLIIYKQKKANQIASINTRKNTWIGHSMPFFHVIEVICITYKQQTNYNQKVSEKASRLDRK